MHFTKFTFNSRPTVAVENCLKKKEFNNFLQILGGRLSHFGKSIEAVFSKLHSTYPEENFGGVSFQKV